MQQKGSGTEEEAKKKTTGSTHSLTLKLKRLVIKQNTIIFEVLFFFIAKIYLQRRLDVQYQQVSTIYLEILFCVPINVIDDQINSRIIDEIITISPNIIKLTHSQGTNAIDVSAVWEEFEIDRRSGDIRAIANVSDVLGVRKKFVVNIKESLKISDSVSWDIKRDPVGQIT